MLQSLKILMVLVAVVFTSVISFAQSEVAQNEAGKNEPMLTQTTSSTTLGNKTSTTTVRKERRAQLNFEDELVEGSTQKPELFYLFQKKNFNYKRLIKLRENFLPEMRRSAEDVQRVRGGN